ncbi:MAG: guanylate kinase [Chloroflexi bacterium]|nr:guanylate kinase [Chloroflexota bacterium]
MPRQGILFILVGPSGAGKNTLMKPVQNIFDDLPQLPTVTTRDIRPGEQEGREHFFVSHAEFQTQIKTGALLEFQNVHMDDFYGTLRQPVDEAFDASRDLIADIDCLGALKIREVYPDKTVLIFVTPSNLDILAERIRHRGNVTPAEVENRLERARFEMTYAPRCDYFIINDIVEPAIEHLRRIIVSERQRRQGDELTIVARQVEPPVFQTQVAALLPYGEKLLSQVRPHGLRLPIFTADNSAQPLHQTLRQQLETALGWPIEVKSTGDTRFGIAPHHVAIGAIPGDVYLYFYYKCVSSQFSAALPPGWEWHTPAELKLPAALNYVLNTEPA